MRPRKQKIKGKEAQSVLQYARQVFSVAAVNGISHVALAKSNNHRIFWTLLFIGGCVGWLYQSAALLKYYYRIRRSVYCKEFPNKCMEKNIILTEEEIFNVTYDFLRRGEKHQLGHQIEDMLINCTFPGKPVLDTQTCLKYFTPLYDPHLGNCFAFTSGGNERPRLQVSEPDAWQDITDLMLLLNSEYDEYLNPSEDTAGLIVTLHENMVLPRVFTNGIHIYANHTYTLKVLKNSVFLLPYPFESNCTDFSKLPFRSSFNMEPSPRLCSVGCLSHLQKTKCSHSYVTDNIVLFENELPYDANEITEEDKECAMDITENYHDYCSTLCNVPCHDVQYSVATVASPTLHNMVVKKSALEEYRRKRGKNKKVFVTDVKIHYQSMEHRIYNHMPEFTTEQLFSFIGGISGGWLGISLMEFCAFLEGLASVIVFSCWKYKSKKRNYKRKKKLSVASKVIPIWDENVYYPKVIWDLPVTRSRKIFHRRYY